MTRRVCPSSLSSKLYRQTKGTTLLERDVRLRYQLEVGATLVVYMGVLLGALTLGKPMQPGVLRQRSLEGLAIAAAVTAALSLTYGFLEGASFPRQSMFWVWPVMGFTWGATAGLRCLTRR